LAQVLDDADYKVRRPPKGKLRFPSSSKKEAEKTPTFFLNKARLTNEFRSYGGECPRFPKELHRLARDKQKWTFPLNLL